GSRRISSAIASRTASPKPMSSRAAGGFAVSSINVLVDFVGIGIRSRDGELDGGVHLGSELGANLLERRRVGEAFLQEPIVENLDWIAIADPLLLLGFRPIVGARDVANVVAVVAVGIEEHERGAAAFTGASDKRRRR